MEDVSVFDDAGELDRKAAQLFTDQARAAVTSRGKFSVALSGGSTPRRLYSLIASKEHPFREQVPWDRIYFFWGDERCVPPDHPDSNYRMATESMLSHVPVPASNIYRMEGEDPDVEGAARRYQEELRRVLDGNDGQFPRLDLVLLGMGPDGHTASLFPYSAALGEKRHWIVANWIEKFKSHRITMTAPLLNHAAHVIFLVQGDEKAGALREVLQGEPQPERYPSQLIRPINGECHWLVDRAAAALLKN